MVLNLHIRLAHMKNCAIILMSSLPAAWIVVGCLLLILALVMTALFLLKSREVATLKKQCEDLRDTMRMMRYEEANLARMLHTANNPTKQAEEALEEEPSVAEEAVEQLVASSVAEELVENASEELDTTSNEPNTTFAPVEIISEETPASTEDIPATETVEAEELVESAEQVEADEPAQPLEAEALLEPLPENTTIEVSLAEAPQVELPQVEAAKVEVPQVETPKPHKQPINERRPAIPTDLFSAWFAENEDTPVAEDAAPQEEIVAEEDLQMEESPVVPVEQVVAVEKPLADAFRTIADAPLTDAPQADVPQEAVETVADASQVMAEASSQVTELSKDDERFCRKLERIVDTRLRNPNLNIDIIAAQFGIGRTNFYRKVRELTGMSPNDYLRKCRMERAAELLRTTDLPVSEVCVQVGVPDAQYFSKVFKVYFETTPTVYREQTK